MPHEALNKGVNFEEASMLSSMMKRLCEISTNGSSSDWRRGRRERRKNGDH
jgi:hypothetical protein